MDGPLPISTASAALAALFAAGLAAPLPGTGAEPAQTIASANAEHLARWVQSIQLMPWLIHAGVGLAFLIGLVLWVRGKPLLKPTIVLLAAVVGGLLGFVLLPVFAPSATVPPWLGMAAGALAGGLLMLAMHRVLAAALFGAVLAVALATVTAGTLTVLSRGQATGALASRELAPRAVQPLAATEEQTPADGFEADEQGSGALAAVAMEPPVRRSIGGEEQPIRSSSPEVLPVGPPRTKPGAAKPAAPAPTGRARPTGNPSGLGGETPSPFDLPSDSVAAPGLKRSVKAPERAPEKLPEKAAAKQAKPAPQRGDDAAGGETAGGTFDPRALQDSAAVASSARNLWAASQVRWQDRWAEVPTAHRIYIIVAALLGAVGGTLAGIVQPAWAAAVLSAIAGSGIAMFTGIWLAHATGLPGHNRINLSAVDYSVVWLTLALVGIAAQWNFMSGGDKAKPGKRKAQRAVPEAE